jgi:enterochelin esterase-like enzyme
VSENYQRDVWVYLKACVQDQTGHYPQLFLLAGKDDRFHESHRLLAAALKDKHVFWAEGGHDWSAWRTAFRAFANQDRAVTIFAGP